MGCRVAACAACVVDSEYPTRETRTACQVCAYHPVHFGSLFIYTSNGSDAIATTIVLLMSLLREGVRVGVYHVMRWEHRTGHGERWTCPELAHPHTAVPSAVVQIADEAYMDTMTSSPPSELRSWKAIPMQALFCRTFHPQSEVLSTNAPSSLIQTALRDENVSPPSSE